MIDQLPEGYTELSSIIYRRVQSGGDPAVVASQREFRRSYLQTHSLADYGKLLVDVSKGIETIGAAEAEMGNYNA